MKTPLQKRGNAFLTACELDGSNVMCPLEIIDPGSSATFLSERVCERAQLECRGPQDKFTRIYEKAHRKVPVGCYRGTVIVGTKSRRGVVCALDVRPAAGGRRGTGALHAMRLQRAAGLESRDGTGRLEGRPRAPPMVGPLGGWRAGERPGPPPGVHPLSVRTGRIRARDWASNLTCERAPENDLGLCKSASFMRDETQIMSTDM